MTWPEAFAIVGVAWAFVAIIYFAARGSTRIADRSSTWEERE